MNGARRTRGRSAGDAVAVLGQHTRPAFTVGAETGVEGFEARSQTLGVTREGVVPTGHGVGAPLRTIEDDVDLGLTDVGLDTVGATVGRER